MRGGGGGSGGLVRGWGGVSGGQRKRGLGLMIS